MKTIRVKTITELGTYHKFWVDYIETMLEQHEGDVDIFVNPETLSLTKRFSDMRLAFSQGFNEGRTFTMSEPREPRFEDDFDCDTDPPEPSVTNYEITLEDIAIEGGHKYAQSTLNRALYAELKEAYKAGFLEGFSYRFTTTDKVSE